MMQQQVYAVDWNRRTGTEFVAASGWGDLRVYDIRKGDSLVAGAFVRLFKGLDSHEATGCAWSKDGRRLVGSWQGGRAYTFDVEAGAADHNTTEVDEVTALNGSPPLDQQRTMENFYVDVGRQRFISRCVCAHCITSLHFSSEQPQTNSQYFDFPTPGGCINLYTGRLRGWKTATAIATT
jgi:WD40 repeat protein